MWLPSYGGEFPCFLTDSSSCCIQSAANTLPPAGSLIDPPSSAQNSGVPSWLHTLPSIQDSYTLSSSDYWFEGGWNAPPVSDICNPRRASLGPLTSSSSLPSWSTLLSSGGSGLPSPATPAGWGKQTSDISPKFDGHDRLSLGEGWFLIRGENAFFLELANRGLDIPVEAFSTFYFKMSADSSSANPFKSVDTPCNQADYMDCK